MIRRSPELEAVAQRWLDALAACNADNLVSQLAADPALQYCGTAENELWSGDFFRRTYASHVAEAPKGSEIVASDLIAHEDGTTGWAFWNGQFRISQTARIVKVRITMIFTLETGSWKIVHLHCSNPTSNLDLYGWDHHALDRLLAAVRDLDPVAGHTGVASIMFTDIADSTAIAGTVGDGVWSIRVQEHLTLVTDGIESNGGTLVKSLGDGTMSVFSSAFSALSAARAIQTRLGADRREPRLQVRIGIHTGDIVQAGDDFFGTVVNKAARVAAAAAPTEVRLTDTTRHMVGGVSEFDFVDPMTLQLKGLEGDHLVFRLQWPA